MQTRLKQNNSHLIQKFNQNQNSIFQFSKDTAFSVSQLESLYKIITYAQKLDFLIFKNVQRYQFHDLNFNGKSNKNNINGFITQRSFMKFLSLLVNIKAQDICFQYLNLANFSLIQNLQFQNIKTLSVLDQNLHSIQRLQLINLPNLQEFKFRTGTICEIKSLRKSYSPKLKKLYLYANNLQNSQSLRESNYSQLSNVHFHPQMNYLNSLSFINGSPIYMFSFKNLLEDIYLRSFDEYNQHILYTLKRDKIKEKILNKFRKINKN